MPAFSGGSRGLVLPSGRFALAVDFSTKGELSTAKFPDRDIY